jgi:ribose transport system permease protein
MTTAPPPVVATPLPRPTSRATRFWRRQGWVVGVALLLGALVLWRSTQIPEFGPFEVRGLVAGTMALALLAMAQSVIVISGGIDLSVGAMMVLANCIAARLMLDQDLGTVVLVAVLVVAVAMVLSGLIGTVAVVSGVPDIVVTLAASFILGGLALIVLDGPGGGTHPRLQEIMVGGFDQPLPSILWLAAALLLVWVPFKRSRLGIATYAVGSDRSAAFLSGLNIGRTRVVAYVLAGFYSGLAGVVTTAFTGSGEPRASIGATATLTSVAAVVLGGVALMGGSGGLLGPMLAAGCLALIPALMLGLGWDPNYAEVARGVIIIVVVMIGGLLQVRRKRLR